MVAFAGVRILSHVVAEIRLIFAGVRVREMSILTAAVLRARLELRERARKKNHSRE